MRGETKRRAWDSERQDELDSNGLSTYGLIWQFVNRYGPGGCGGIGATRAVAGPAAPCCPMGSSAPAVDDTPWEMIGSSRRTGGPMFAVAGGGRDRAEREAKEARERCKNRMHKRKAAAAAPAQQPPPPPQPAGNRSIASSILISWFCT